MTWQFLIAGYFIFATSSFLIRRILAKTFSQYLQLVNFVFFLMFLYPGGLILSIFVPHNLNVGFLNLLFLFFGSLIFPIVNLLAYKANKELDVGFFSVISNLAPVVSITGATLLLNEELTNIQLIGALFLIISAIAVSLPNVNLKKVSRAHADAFWTAISAVLLLGIGIVFERFMLIRIDFGAYLIIGWGSQTFWATLIAIIKKVDLSPLNKWQTSKVVLIYGLSNTLKALCFISALLIAENASLISAASSFVGVLVVISAFIFLKERDDFWLKFGAVIVSCFGLYLL